MHNSTELSRADCLQLLSTRTVGRIAFQTDNGLRIFPVNYVVDGERIVFRTVAYGVISRSVRGNEVAFQVDDLDEQLHTGWSVLAVGPCERIEDPDELARIRRTDSPTPWAAGARDLHFAIAWRGLSGRRLGDA